jgi:hypothetical protein
VVSKPTLNRNRIAFYISVVALSAAMVIWGDLFRWSKSVYIPDWAKALPHPMRLPSYLTFVCLLPAALGTDSLASALGAVLKAVLIAPIAAVIAYAVTPGALNASLPFNVQRALSLFLDRRGCLCLARAFGCSCPRSRCGCTQCG